MLDSNVSVPDHYLSVYFGTAICIRINSKRVEWLERLGYGTESRHKA